MLPDIPPGGVVLSDDGDCPAGTGCVADGVDKVDARLALAERGSNGGEMEGAFESASGCDLPCATVETADGSADRLAGW